MYTISETEPGNRGRMKFLLRAGPVKIPVGTTCARGSAKVYTKCLRNGHEVSMRPEKVEHSIIPKAREQTECTPPKKCANPRILKVCSVHIEYFVTVCAHSAHHCDR